jgi:hypothetical protein
MVKLALLLPIVAACAVDVTDATDPAELSAPGDTATEARHPAPPIAFPPDAEPAGHDLVQWSQRWWRWVYAQPAAHNPMFDRTGADCGVGQRGDVFFLASVVDPGGVATISRRCTIPAHEPILVSPGGALNDFPCPDPAFLPGPGQSLYDFLRLGIAPVVDSVTAMTVRIDGRALANPFAYRTTSRRVFTLTGDLSLVPVFDGCITGAPQSAVADGYFMMLHGLDRGTHHLVLRSVDSKGTDVTIQWTLDIR